VFIAVEGRIVHSIHLQDQLEPVVDAIFDAAQ
jgi:hypothetical protein